MTKTKLANEYWGPGRFGGLTPCSGGGVKTTVPAPTLDSQVPPDTGSLQPNPGQFVGSEPGGPASGEPIMPERGRTGI
jgi:hypothetical protein